MEPQTTDDGLTGHVAEDESEIGSTGPFYIVYKTDDRDDRLGYLCSNCGTMDNAMDPMGQIVCNECGNTRRPEEWDAAHE